MHSEKKILREKFRSLTTLPTLPEIASRLLRMVNDPGVAARDIAAIIGQDVSLSSKVIRLANSAFYGMPGKITSIDRAVVLLGFKIISTIVLSVTVFDMFPENKRSRRLFDRKAFWLHSLGCGLISRSLAFSTRNILLLDPDEAFCAGLLHDIGKVVLEQYLHQEFHAALKTARSAKIPLHEAETETLGFSHADTAAWMIENWALPSGIAQAIACHHSPPLSHERHDAAELCHMADWLCYRTGMVIDTVYTEPAPKPECLQTFAITESVINEMKNTIPAEVTRSEIFLSLRR